MFSGLCRHRGLQAPRNVVLLDRHHRAIGTNLKITWVGTERRLGSGWVRCLHHITYTAGWTYACELMAVNQALLVAFRTLAQFASCCLVAGH